VVRDGRHPLEHVAGRDFTALCRRTFA